jgi:hypothetical protein
MAKRPVATTQQDSETPNKQLEGETKVTEFINDPTTGNVSVTEADNDHNKAVAEENENKAMVFQAGPKFQEAIQKALDDFNNKLAAQGTNGKLSMAAFLRRQVATSILFDLSLDPQKSRSKYASDEERKAAIKLSQQKAAQERKDLNKLIAAAKNKQTRKQAIAALMESLGITDEDLDD